MPCWHATTLLLAGVLPEGMVHAFIMVKAGAGAATDVCDELGRLDGVEDAHVVAGRYDVIAEVGGDEVGNVLQTVSKEVGTVPGVTDTKTYISLAAA